MLNRRSDHIDKLIERIWQLGYAATSRKYAAYLPVPPMIGEYEVDFIARSRNAYAIGLFIDESDFNQPEMVTKIEYLATRKHKATNRQVLLFLGVPISLFFKVKKMIANLTPAAQENIRLYPTNAPEPTDLFALSGTRHRSDTAFTTN